MPTGNRQFAKPIPGVPWIIRTTDDTLNGFLAGLAPVDFQVIADPKGVWAVVASNAGEGTASSAGTTYVVSDETFRRVKAHRYQQTGQ